VERVVSHAFVLATFHGIPQHFVSFRYLPEN
jgi:hypothetical protein